MFEIIDQEQVYKIYKKKYKNCKINENKTIIRKEK
jgi:hypothetical protein